MNDRRKQYSLVLGVVALCVTACGPAPASDEVPALVDSDSSLSVSAAGSIPAGLPQRLMIGLKEDKGGSWMSSSGVPWDARYMYLTMGWANNWGYSAYDGAYALNYFRECAAAVTVPSVVFYEMNDEPGGGEDQFLAKSQNATTMRSYFGDFLLLMKRAKDFGKPVVVLVEPDGFGLLEQQARENPNVAASVASTGMPELAGLPNTVAGWGLAFLKLKEAAGASNVVLGIHVSGWASGKDLFYYSITDALGPEVDKVYAFLAPMGLGANLTGKTYDVLVGDPLDRDSDYYKLVQGDGSAHWWDASDTASVSSRSFNRYAEWLRLWNVKSAKRWVLWQIALGNSNHLNVTNSGSPRQGYKDNRTEYFFGAGGNTHLSTWAQKGVIALLFGRGATGQSTYLNDQYTDGQLFMKSRAGAFLKAGGLPLGSGTTTTTTTTADAGTTTTADAGTSTTDAGVAGDSAQYSFETGAQGWASAGTLATVASSSSVVYAGTRSLAVNLAAAAAGTEDIAVFSPATPAGAKVTYQVWCPAGAKVSAVQAYAMQGSGGGWAWTGVTRSGSSLLFGAWNAFVVTVPSTAATPLNQIGVEFTLSGAWTGTCYIDSVAW